MLARCYFYKCHNKQSQWHFLATADAIIKPGGISLELCSKRGGFYLMQNVGVITSVLILNCVQ